MDAFCDSDIQKNQTGLAITFKACPYMLNREEPRTKVSSSDLPYPKSKYKVSITINCDYPPLTLLPCKCPSPKIYQYDSMVAFSIGKVLRLTKISGQKFDLTADPRN